MSKRLIIKQAIGGFFVEAIGAGQFEAVCTTLDELKAVVERFFTPPIVVAAPKESTPDEEPPLAS